MGLRSKIKKRLPIFGRRSSAPVNESPTSQSESVSYQPPVVEEPKTARGDQPVEEFIESTVKENQVVLFMKGSPESPMCGFSANAAGILASYGTPFMHVDVISDPDVRQGIKDFSMWPTLPQIYINGEFLGGSDILSQMHQNGEL
ncbi:MAG: Grx4 family monothiol glutaredoxin, partial [Myxococcota bacterium]|nr:Grx4 family monothiol glutaredoxin [Myxococcota bacterium]